MKDDAHHAAAPLRPPSQRKERQDVDACIARLTNREAEVMRYILTGAPNKIIADRMGLSQRTVEGYRAGMFRKMQVGNAVELVRRVQAGEAYRGWRECLSPARSIAARPAER